MNGFVRPELHDPIALCEKSEIAPDTYKIPGIITCAPLTDDNTARGDLLPAVSLYAEALGIGVPPVCGTALTFCMCHVVL